MTPQGIACVDAVLRHIEAHLHEKLTLDRFTMVTHYSSFHFHRLFSLTLGLTPRDYVQRRQLTEAARALIASDRPILEIALAFGYESQQAFSAAFKTMYKLPPAAYRRRGRFYPLQLPLNLDPQLTQPPDNWQMRLATAADGDAWMALARMAIAGYPGFEENSYWHTLNEKIRAREALVALDGDRLLGALAFSRETGVIDYLGVHPQALRWAVEDKMLQAARSLLAAGQTLSMTTFRAQDRADIGQRAMLMRLGFAPQECLSEYDYPTQRFVRQSEARGGRP